MAENNRSYTALLAALAIIALTAFTVDAMLAESNTPQIQLNAPDTTYQSENGETIGEELERVANWATS